ncbi:MAG: TonB-dependent receptor, partial [Methanococcaceae archaeon]
ELIQVQRGAGAGSIGYPAIGGAINIITATFSNAPKFEVSTALGSYNTRKYSASFSSGLIGNKYSIYAKLGKILSSGYRDLAWADYNSYHISAVRYDENVTSQINFYGGPISDGLSYTGLPKEYIKDKLLRKKNYSDWGPDGQGGLYTVNRKPTEIENFSQPHFELLNDIRFNENVSLNSALFLILGSGFYDYDAYWADKNYFRLTPENGFVDNGEALIDPLIRAQVDNKQFGWIPKMSLKHVNGELIIGSELRFHRSLHWGGISYAGNLPAGTDKDYRYYEYKGKNDIVNLFAHENYNISDKFNMSAEIQLAYHQYGIYNEKYVGNEFSIHNMFINPRLGINYKNNDNLNIYFSYALVNHEPRLKNYYDAAEASGGAIPQFERLSDGSYDYSNPLVKPETMNDIELGSNFSNTFLSAGCSLFYMYFNNEIVKNGQVDRFGQPITGNIDHTIHTGLELTAALKINSYLEFLFNSTLSKNYIGSGGEWINYKVGEDAKVNYLLDLSGNRISGFPDFLSNLSVKYKYSGLTVLLTMKYMGSYYSDNYDKHLIEYQAKYPFFEVPYNDNKVDDYFSSDFFASFEMKNIALGNSLKVYLQVNNIFDRFYATYAIGKEFFPGAERNVIGGVQLDL